MVTKEELDKFHKFATSHVEQEEAGLTWRQLFELWRMHHPTNAQTSEDAQAIQQSLDALANGQMRPFSEFMAEFRTQLPASADEV